MSGSTGAVDRPGTGRGPFPSRALGEPGRGGRGYGAVACALSALLLVVLAVATQPVGAAGSLAPSGRPPLALAAVHRAAQPPPTTSPSAPGIQIASVRGLDLPDPDLVTVGATYYLYLSTAFGDSSYLHVPFIVGTPRTWASAGAPVPIVKDALPVVPQWASPSAPVWEPDVVRLGNKYVMYMAPELARYAPATHCIGVATSRSPAGPFVPVGTTPLICQLSLGGDIDAQLFTDPAGPNGPAHPNYLVWKSDNNNLAGSGPTTIWAAPVSNDGLRLTGRSVAIFRPDRVWERPVMEAPQMVHSPAGGDWLIFSAGRGFFTSRYAMGAAQCAGPLGGCHSVSDGPLLATNEQGAGPGEETVFVAANHATWVLYSPWHVGILTALFRPVEAVQLGWTAKGPYLARKQSFPSP